jgi:hypothetical protein
MLMTGTTNSPLQDLTKHSYVDFPWLLALRTFLQQSNTTIEIPNLIGPMLLRINDQPIMTALTGKQFSTQQLRTVNECRLWLQVTSMAEITDIDGTEILPAAINGTHGASNTPTLWLISQSKLRWPSITRPNPQAWKLWKEALSSLTADRTRRLQRPLGKWNSNWALQRKWHFRSSDNGHYIQRTMADNTIHHYHLKRKTTAAYHNYRRTSTLPPNDHFHQPISPLTINNENITISNKSTSSSRVPSPRSTDPSPRLVNIRIRNDSHNTRNTRLIIGIHNTNLYDYHKFTWTLAKHKQHIIQTGKVQKFSSRTCSSIRGGLIGILQATIHALKTLAEQNTNPNLVSLVICSKDKKTLRALNKQRHTNQSPSLMLAPKTGILHEIFPLLTKFKVFKTHHSTKND